MNYERANALKALELIRDRISSESYEAIHDGLTEIEMLRDRDEELENLWEKLGDIPMDPETECIEEPFLYWGPGIHREEIWHWFDQRHSKGVAYLLYGSAENYVAETKRLYALNKLCFECESRTCQYNHDGECRFALVHERQPRIKEEDGCVDFEYNEGEE